VKSKQQGDFADAHLAAAAMRAGLCGFAIPMATEAMISTIESQSIDWREPELFLI